MQFKLVVAVLALVLVNSVISAPAEDIQTSVSSSQVGSQTFTSGFAAVSGSDGKTYYVKDVNGHIEKGIMEGPPPSIDLSGVFASALRPTFPFYPALKAAPVDNLNSEIRNSVNQYLQNLRI